MKKSNAVLNRNTAALALVVSSFSFAAAGLPAFADDVVNHADAPLVITQENLDSVLFGNNTDLAAAMNMVVKAKDEVNIARAALLPSISINLVMAIANPPAFLLNTTTCLVPFLFPTAWYNYASMKHNLSAEVMALHVARLNVYSQAYALAIQVGGDERVLTAQQQFVDRYTDYVKNLQLQADLGVMQQSDVMIAELERARVTEELSVLRQLVDDERASLRKLFGLDMSQKFAFELAAVPVSQFEKTTPATLLPDVVARAPERLQIDQLIYAAQGQVRAAWWAWLGGCQGAGIGYQTGAGGAFGVSTGASVNVGFGWYPQLQLARHNVVDLEVRKQELNLELGRIVESSLADISEIKIRAAEAKAAAATGEKLLAEQNELLPLGRVNVREMIGTYQMFDQAMTSYLSSQAALDGHRITLKRVTLEDGFLKVYIDSRRQLEIGYR